MSVEAKLAEYRAKKRRAQQEEVRHEWLWSLVTLAPLRQKLSQFLAAQPEVEPSEPENPVLQPLPPEPWSTLDWAILGVGCLLWSMVFYAAVLAEIGAVYFLTSGFAFIWLNLGTRGRGQASAYSVFNPNCESIDGTLTAEQFEREIRHKSM